MHFSFHASVGRQLGTVVKNVQGIGFHVDVYTRKEQKRLIRYDKSFEATFRCVVQSICHHVCILLTDTVEPNDAYTLYEGYKVHELLSSSVEMENGIICVLF